MPKMSLRDLFDLNSRRFKRYDKLLSSRRRLLIVVILAGLFIFYLLPVIFRRFTTPAVNKEDLTSECIQSFLRSFQSEIDASDSSVWIYDLATATVSPTAVTSSTINIGDVSRNSYLPLVGNGKFAIHPTGHLDTDRRFHIMSKRILDTPVPFDPVVNIRSFGTHEKSAIVTRYHKGSVERCTCANYGGGVITIRETFTAHRLIPTLFTQHIRIFNPTNGPLLLELSRKGWLDKSSTNVKLQPIMVATSDHREYSILLNEMENKSTRGKQHRAVAIAYSSLHNTIEVHANQQSSLVVQTFLNYTNSFGKQSELQDAIPDLKISLRETVKRILQLSSPSLHLYHEGAWTNLWHSGFAISYSHAPEVVNGYQINATLYYLLCQRPMAFRTNFDISSATISSGELITLSDVDTATTETRLHQPDRCYNDHSTLEAPRLWHRMNSLATLQHVLSMWYLTLEKHSCEHLLQSGARGVLQATLLSLSGLRFTTKHLEFRSHPSELQRPFLVRRLYYGNDTAINISVHITEENKAQIQIALDHYSKNKDYYACDAGCLDAPVRLSSALVDFPVKLTSPLTSLLYITSDREHVRELKHSIHVKEIGEAPPHEHHTIAIHRYGYSLGGLPTFFWVTIVILIIVFHVFLGKLIYNEYFNANQVPYERLNVHRNIGRYSM